MISLNEGYTSKFEEASKLIEKNDFFRVFSHYDADGVSSALILAETLRRLNKGFHLSFLRSMEMDVIRESSSYPIILSDLGTELSWELKSSGIVIVDHHMISGPLDNEYINLNPRKFGYDGTKEACSSTVAFLLSLTINSSNYDLFPAFLAGVIGDKQNIGGFNGINGMIIEDLKGKYPFTKDLNIIGKSVSEAIYLSIEPYFDGLSGDMEASRFFLQNLTIDPDTLLTNLRTDEKEKIVDSLTMKLVKQNAAKEGYETLVSDIFTFKDLGLTGNQISEYFDAAGRNGRMGLPTSWYMGNEDAKDEMDGLSTKLRKEALEQIKKSFESRKEMKNLHFTYVENPYLAGITASILMLYLVRSDKPVIALYKNKGTKVSGRATRELVSKGLDLSRAIGDAALGVGGHGGGHNIAAGGEIPFDREDEFLQRLNEGLGEQFGNP
ncbi:MAG: DHH family phosphoesterase [Thermoplasmatales archaeon]|jgi:RecJ-like exonuclease|nr:DHH family phosphoesterase [Candidatus Thermoplasmatota archaeon]MCL6003586.1 DHH family phosphoesterase [Candidatus Thermoplasmatota archaeon]MDA8054769.1 DHH family phosphoesterase [Thermoplasmatales archaeon]